MSTLKPFVVRKNVPDLALDAIPLNEDLGEFDSLEEARMWAPQLARLNGGALVVHYSGTEKPRIVLRYTGEGKEQQ